MDAGDELVDVVDENDDVIGSVSRREMRAKHLVHRCTYVFVLTPAGELYVHKRTDTKDVYPGYDDVCAGGVNAAGESYDDCARRELEEELGITAAPRFLFKHRYEGPDGSVWGAVYEVEWEGSIRHQESEVAWGTFVSMDELPRMLEEHEFCADSREIFDRWRAEGR